MKFSVIKGTINSIIGNAIKTIILMKLNLFFIVRRLWEGLSRIDDSLEIICFILMTRAVNLLMFSVMACVEIEQSLVLSCYAAEIKEILLKCKCYIMYMTPFALHVFGVFCSGSAYTDNGFPKLNLC